MNGIKTKYFCMLSDFMRVRQFMTEIYEKDWRNGVPAPFLEYALSCYWMDTSLTHKDCIWLDGEKIAAFVFYECPTNNIFFSLRPGYEELAEEMVAYADKHMPRIDGKLQLMIFKGQDAIMDAAEKAGFAETYSGWEMIYEYEKPLEFSLPEGFRFADPNRLDAEKIMECLWKGFDHQEKEGPFDSDGKAGTEAHLHMLTAPHATQEYAVAIENETGDYVCYAGMWWTPENRLAYMEPLCTVPQYRRKGLAAAAMSELYRRMKPLGADHMTGGFHAFYKALGLQPVIGWTGWENREA